MEKKDGMERAIGMTRRHCLFTMISAAVVVVCVCIGAETFALQFPCSHF